jgi:hypothetical protein
MVLAADQTVDAGVETLAHHLVCANAEEKVQSLQEEELAIEFERFRDAAFFSTPLLNLKKCKNGSRVESGKNLGPCDGMANMMQLERCSKMQQGWMIQRRFMS